MTPLGILLRQGGHDAAHYALVLATGAAALGRPVTLFATNAGCRLLLAECPLLTDPREAALALLDHVTAVVVTQGDVLPGRASDAVGQGGVVPLHHGEAVAGRDEDVGLG